jgi:starch synthase
VEDWHAGKAAGKETGTGFSFEEYSGAALIKCLNRAIDTFRDKTIWEKIQRNGMQKEFSWEKAARTYMDLYLRLNDVN